MPKERPLTTGDVARYLHMTHMGVLKWIRSGKLRAYRAPGGYHRIEREEFRRFLRENNIPIPEELQAPELERVLVVDDDPAILELFEIIVSRKGYHISTASDGLEALELLKKGKYNLIFLDVILPGKSGPELFRSIRELDPKAMVVLVTGYPHHQQVMEAMEFGPVMLMRKPLGVKDIEAVLEIVFKGE